MCHYAEISDLLQAVNWSPPSGELGHVTESSAGHTSLTQTHKCRTFNVEHLAESQRKDGL